MLEPLVDLVSAVLTADVPIYSIEADAWILQFTTSGDFCISIELDHTGS